MSQPEKRATTQPPGRKESEANARMQRRDEANSSIAPLRPRVFALNSGTEANARPPDYKPSLLRRAHAVPARWFGPDWPWIAAVLLIALIAAWPAVSQPGLLNTRGGGDSPFLLQRLQQLTAALVDGHFPVRWMPDANYGYGYPFYNFYAPLSIYIAAVFRFLGFSFVRAIHLAQIAGFIAAGLGMYCLGRRWLGSRWAGLLAAAAYTVAPFHMVNVYVRGDSLAEFWAMAFYPWILLAAERLFREGEKGGRGEGEQGRKRAAAFSRSLTSIPGRRIALFAIAYASLILSHNISALIFTPFLLLYVAARLLPVNREQPNTNDETSSGQSAVGGRRSAGDRSRLHSLWSVVGGILLAFALAAWFFVPALAERGLAQLGPVTEGYFHFSNHFRGLDLVQGGLLFDYNPDGGVAFRLGLVQVGLAVAGAVAWLLSRRTTDNRPQTTGSANRKEAGEQGSGGAEETISSFVIRHSSLVIISALIAVFMITPLSRPLWDHLPLLPFTQFPWRFLSVASFFMAFLAGGLVLASDRPAARAAIAATGALVLLAAGLLGLRVDHLILTDADVTTERLAQYEWFTGNIGTTVSAEYLTPESSPRPWASAWLNAAERDQVAALSGELSAELVARESTQQTWRVVVGNGGAQALFPTMNWLGWEATIDGLPAALESLPSSGLMVLDIPAGEHTVRLELGRTPVRLAAELVSLAAVVVAAFLLVISRGKRLADHGQQTTEDALGSGGEREKGGKGTAETEITLSPLLPFAASLICALLLFAFLWRNDPQDLPRGDLTWDFAQMGYLHHTPGGVPFSDGSRLYEYGYSADGIAAGETLTVTLSITPGGAGSATLALVTPAAARPVPNGAVDPPILTAQTIAVDGETAVFSLPIPPDAPAGLYVPRLTLEGAQPMTPSGVTRGDLFLRPLWITADGGRAQPAEACDLPPGDCGPAADIVTADIHHRDATTLDGRFVWSVLRPLGGRYQVSWRAQNGDGVVLSQIDSQPGYGFNPTDGWLPNSQINDWLALRLPNALAGPPPYPLVMILYDATTGDQLLVRRVGELVEIDGQPIYQPVAPTYTLPVDGVPLDVAFGENGQAFIRLRGYELAQSADALEVTLFWQATGDIPADFTRFIHLVDENGAVASQVDGHPVGNSYPTGQWTQGEIVADTVRFDMSSLPDGAYRLAAGFYRPIEGLPRLESSGPDGPMPDGLAILPEMITIPRQ